jgi:hypothetical protein
MSRPAGLGHAAFAPDDEKRLWHSHHYEVKSGILVAPGIPDLAEHA